MCDCSIHCTWLKYFTELVEEISCTECIKTNLKNSNKCVKHFDLYCEKCDQNKYEKHENSDECSWYKYFIELLDEINCVNCIKVNVQKSTNKRKHFDYYCIECRDVRMFTKY